MAHRVGLRGRASPARLRGRRLGDGRRGGEGSALRAAQAVDEGKPNDDRAAPIRALVEAMDTHFDGVRRMVISRLDPAEVRTLKRISERLREPDPSLRGNNSGSTC